MAIKIITDSTSDISIVDIEKMGIDMLPLKVSFGDETFADKYELSSENFFEKLKTSTVSPTTALVNIEEFTESFNKYPDDQIIAIVISSKISGTYQSAVIARDHLNRAEDKANGIFIIDSQSTSIGMALIVHQIKEWIDGGMTAKEAYEKAVKLSDKVRIFCAFDTLKYLVRGGRLSGTQGFIGNLLGLKPIIRMKQGVISSVGKARGMSNAIIELTKLIDADGGINEKIKVFFAHAENLPDLNALKDALLKSYKFEIASNSLVGSVVGAHAGPRAIAVAYCTND
jgi:DegV family protein with EDD domain